jgi:ribosomal protein L7/L12
MKEALIIIGIIIAVGCLKLAFGSKPKDMTKISTPTTDISEEEIKNLIRAGNKIGAIKLYRAKTGFGLKEAKLAVDQMEI